MSALSLLNGNSAQVGLSVLLLSCLSCLCHELPVQAQGPSKRTLHFTETEYGRSLDAAANGIELPAPAKALSRPLTFQARIRIEPRAFRFRNVVIAVGDESGQPVWQLYSEGRSGLTWESPGVTPPIVTTDTSIADGKWHDVAMLASEDRLQLFVDSRQVADQKLAGLPPVDRPGKLWIGQALDGSRGFDGWLDDVHLASEIRPLRNSWKPVEATLLYLDFEESQSEYLSQWTPLRSTRADAEPWERETDDDWIDDRFQEMDKGPAFACSTQLPGRWAGPKNLTISLDGPGRHQVVFDTQRCMTTAVYRQSTLRTSPRRFGILQMPVIEGTELAYADARRGWERQGVAALTRFEGFYRRGQDIVLSYDVAGADVLEFPGLVGLSSETMLVVRRIELGIARPQTDPRILAIAELDGQSWSEAGDHRLQARVDGEFVQLELVVAEGQARLSANEGRARIQFSPGRNRVALLLHRGPQTVPPNALTVPEIDRGQLQDGGHSIWPQTLVLKGQRGADEGAYAVDTIPIPEVNPWKALLFVSGFDFFQETNRAAVCTVHGDVWLVDGLDGRLDQVRWKRFAGGLYQPLGLKIVRERIYVLGRDQITRLDDFNGDGEADFYANFNNDLVINGTPHAYATCLETDPEGWFYFFKCGKDQPHGGKLLRVSPDGKRLEVFASGYRHPIGLGISPEGMVTAADNQGNWVPASSIQRVSRGSFHGYMPELHRPQDPGRFDPPLVWLPMVADNSSGGQTWVTSPQWGPLQQRMLHVSWGRCNLMAVLEQQVGEVSQAAAVVFPGIQFLSGPIRPRFSPHDGQLYVCGLDGWQTAAVRDGSFQRVRYTGNPSLIPVEFSAHQDGLRLRFSEELDQSVCLPENFHIERWQYRWTAEYGSPEYSLEDPNRIGHDPVVIESVSLTDGGKTLFLKIPDLKPAMQMHLKASLATVDGLEQDLDIYHTIHALAEAWTDR